MMSDLQSTCVAREDRNAKVFGTARLPRNWACVCFLGHSICYILWIGISSLKQTPVTALDQGSHERLYI